MTEKFNSKHRKFLIKPRLTPIGDRKSQPVILTDSKGQINRHVTHPAERHLLWWSKTGSTVD
jgi:hypothetical protein